jgi:hypothetical protein
MQIVSELNARRPFVYSIAVGGEHVYFASTDNGEAVVEKADRTTFAKVGELAIPAASTLRSVVIDGGYAYFSTATTPSRVIKVDLSTFQVVGSVTLNSDEKVDRLVVSDMSNLYYATIAVPFRLIKVAKKYQPPGPPTDVTVVPGVGQLTVSWAPPLSEGDGPITGYSVANTLNSQSIGAKTCFTIQPSSCTLSLSNGVNHAIYVRAINLGGPGEPTLVYGKPRTTPGQVTGLSASPASRSVRLTWNAPDFDGGAPITSYTAVGRVNGQTDSFVCTSTTTSCVLTGLSNGTTYSIKVYAENLVGAGPTRSVSATPVGRPEPPQSVVALPGDRQVTVSWQPGTNGGSPITGYTATANPSGQTCTTSGQLTCQISNLTNGSSYSISVASRNVYGLGDALNSPNPVIPQSGLSAPRDVVATPSAGLVTVTWNPPLASGSSPIRGYWVTGNPGERTCYVESPLTTCAMAAENGVPHTYTVVAVNATDESPASDPSNPVTPLARPSGSPVVAAVRPGDGTLTIEWEYDDQTAPVTGFLATATPYLAAASPDDPSCSTDGEKACTISGLINGEGVGPELAQLIKSRNLLEGSHSDEGARGGNRGHFIPRRPTGHHLLVPSSRQPGRFRKRLDRHR